jgi:hypothetical protein
LPLAVKVIELIAVLFLYRAASAKTWFDVALLFSTTSKTEIGLLVVLV